MVLPGRLRQTTLGDLLGTLHRAAAHGTLEVVEDLGRTHRVHIASGLVVAVEFDGAAATLAEMLRSAGTIDDGTLRHSLLRAITSKRLHGEVLVKDFHISESVVDAAVRKQMATRLARIEQLTDARITFRVTLRPPRGAVLQAPLGPHSFLAGRRRFRDRGNTSASRAREPQSRVTERTSEAPTSAWRVLGVSPGADDSEIKRAYRRLARDVHPDLHPDATGAERQELSARFNELTMAYKTLKSA